MNKFPLIKNISDVLPHLDNRPEFIVADREGYKVINYQVMMRDTFPDLDDDSGAILRECRGIIFCSKTGKILRRPLHKFFNVNERAETFVDNIDLSKPHVILEKLDGSMIAPFMLDGKVRFGTKMGCTDVALPVEEFVENHPDYYEFSNILLNQSHAEPLQPIFEWCSRKQRIVLDYVEDQLVLVAIRKINTGEYIPHAVMLAMASSRDIVVVDTFNPNTNGISEFIEHVKGLEDLEGFVIRFDDGQMLKMKCDWYVQIHKAKEAVMQDRNIVGLIIDNMLDDIISAFPTEERERLSNFEAEVSNKIKQISNGLQKWTDHYSKNYTKKDFALRESLYHHRLDRSAIFALWDDHSDAKVLNYVLDTVRKHLTNNARYAILMDQWFEGVTYNNG